jgi:cell division protein FtsA
LDIDDLILEPLASSMAVLSQEEKEAGVCLVDIGGGTTDIAIFHENIIRHTAVIPFGGNILTSDIKQGCSVMEHQAEQLKTKWGKAIAEEANDDIISIPGLKNRPPKEISLVNLAKIIEARMEEIVELIHTEIIRSGFENKLAGGIVITGGGSQLNNLQQLVEYMTGMDARIGYPNEHLGKSRIEAMKSPMYATSIGLVLSGFRYLDERNNLYMEQKSRIKATTKQKDKPTQSENFFKKMLEKGKKMLIDDFDDNKDY